MISLFPVVLCVPSFVAGRIIYVDADASGANDGSTWQDAYKYLQDALADANSAQKPVEIRVAQGVYKPDQRVGVTPGDRTATFRLINGVTLKGGYAGFGEPDPNNRDITLYESTLSGDLLGNDVDVNDTSGLLNELTRTENSLTIVKGYRTNVTAVLDGFTVTGGNYDIVVPDSRGYPLPGAGMDNFSGSPTVINCTFIRNSAKGGAAGICNRVNSNPTISTCTFKANMGGGMRNTGMYNSGSNPTVLTSTFSSNSGGGMINDFSSPTVLGCRFIGNSATYGGAMRNYRSNPVLTDSLFIGNSATQGGAVHNNHSSPVLTNCLFIGNRAYYSGEEFTGHGAAMCNSSYSHPVVNSSTFSQNSADDTGGAVYSTYSGATFTNCTFAANSAVQGNALACNSYGQKYPSDLQIMNCILWDGGGEIWSNDGSEIKISYSDLEGGQTAVYDPCERVVWGDGNIEADPLFAQPEGGDHHLKSQAGRWDPETQSCVKDDVTSPCIDTGDPTSPIGAEPFPNGGRINMGAYGGTAEASKSYFGKPMCETVISGDINGDCKVDFADFAIMASHWMECNSPEVQVQITDVKIIKGELVEGWFKEIEEAEKLRIGDIFVIRIKVSNLGCQKVSVFNLYGWDLSPQNHVEVIGDSVLCAAVYRLEPGESAYLGPSCPSQAFTAKQNGLIIMNIHVKDWMSNRLFEYLFNFEILTGE